MKKIIISIVLVFSFIVGFSQTENTSQENNESPKTENQWKFKAVPYIYMAGISGSISFLSQSAPIEAEFSDILNKLGFAGMFHGEMQKNNWSIMTDIIYIKLKKGGSLVNERVPVDGVLEETIFEIGGGYGLIKNDNFSLDLLAGARFFNLCTTISNSNTTLLEKKLNFTDPYIGARYALRFNKWTNNTRFDAGGFDVGSELSWKFNFLIGYELSQKTSLYLGYQGYDVKYVEEKFTYDVYTAGPLLGVNLNFHTVSV